LRMLPAVGTPRRFMERRTKTCKQNGLMDLRKLNSHRNAFRGWCVVVGASYSRRARYASVPSRADFLAVLSVARALSFPSSACPWRLSLPFFSVPLSSLQTQNSRRGLMGMIVSGSVSPAILPPRPIVAGIVRPAWVSVPVACTAATCSAAASRCRRKVSLRRPRAAA